MKGKNNHLYQPSGYLATNYCYNDGSVRLWLVGGRAIGKTFNVLTYLIENNIKFLLVRSYEDEFKVACTEAMNPFIKHNTMYDWSITTNKINPYLGGIYSDTDCTHLIGNIASLSSIGHMRGWTGLDDIMVIFYDEFIQLPGQRKVSNQGQRFRDLYETVNRNRELEGRPPVKCVFASNANTINNDLLLEYGIINPIMHMIRSGQEYKKLEDSGDTIVFPMYSEISERKAHTANYKGNSKYNKMAILNQFDGYYSGNVKSMKLDGFSLKCIFDDIYFYQTPDNYIYLSYTKKGSCKLIYGDSDFEKEQFKRKNKWLIDAYFDNRLKFENDELEVRFNQIYEKK